MAPEAVKAGPMFVAPLAADRGAGGSVVDRTLLGMLGIGSRAFSWMRSRSRNAVIVTATAIPMTARPRASLPGKRRVLVSR